jgi:hypothetical protein
MYYYLAAIVVIVILVVAAIWYRNNQEKFYGTVAPPPAGSGLHVWSPDRSITSSALLGGEVDAVNRLAAAVPGSGPLLKKCSQCRPWNPSAVAEAQGLAQVGALQHTDYNETDFQEALSQAYHVSQGYPWAYRAGYA